MFQCPSCKADNLQIHHLVYHITDVNREETVANSEPGDLEWDDKDKAYCLDCYWLGTVKDMTFTEED